jgi:hypothetical protein
MVFTALFPEMGQSRVPPIKGWLVSVSGKGWLSAVEIGSFEFVSSGERVLTPLLETTVLPNDDEEWKSVVKAE